jgi:hypothetical protein
LSVRAAISRASHGGKPIAAIVGDFQFEDAVSLLSTPMPAISKCAPVVGRGRGDKFVEPILRDTHSKSLEVSVSELSSRLVTHSLKLLQEAHIVFVKHAQVVQIELDHGEAFDTETEGEAGVAFGVVANVFQHLGCTMPQPPSSIQPVRLQVAHPLPLQKMQLISNSADGSVNGK